VRRKRGEKEKKKRSKPRKPVQYPSIQHENVWSLGKGMELGAYILPKYLVGRSRGKGW
jgi:hypothetical protein